MVEVVLVFGAERRQIILDLVRLNGSVSIADLARAVNTSTVTVRRDVTTLEKRGVLVRSHGGAMLADDDRLSQATLGDPSSIPAKPMFGAERRRLISALVHANDAASLGELARTLNVSEMTVRRDLDILDRHGLIQRTRGGALAGATQPEAPDAGRPTSADTRADSLSPIALAARDLAAVDGPVMLGAGATVYALARHLRPTRPLTVLTNSILVARALSHTPHVELVMAGGALDGPSLSLVGSSAERWVATHRVARAFISGAGVTPARGVSSVSLELSGVERAMVASADEVVVLADGSKLGVETTYQVATVSEMNHLVTDRRNTEIASRFASLGVQVHLAAVPGAVPA